MTTIIANKDVLTIQAGLKIPNLLHAALPQTASQNIYTVSGGRILVVHLFGEVTTIVQAQTTNFKFTSTPTTGSAIDLCANVDLTGLEIGGHVTLPNPPAAATAGVKALAGALNLEPLRLIVPIGNISVTTGASSTGGLKYDLIYIPLDSGAQVVAA